MVNVRRRAALSGVTLLTTLAAVVMGVAPARADDQRRQVASCDVSGCLIAHLVVDSDGDGVCDADELLAGTDPHDPTSVPPLRQLVELAGKELLPSFENGLAAFVVLPADIAEKRLPEGTPDLLSAFPMGGRKSTLETLGISSDLMAAHGIDLETGGLTIGLGDTGTDGPPRRVGGIDVRLISAGGDDDPTPLPQLPKLTSTSTTWHSNGDVETVYNYSDGSMDRDVSSPDGTTRGEHVASDGRQTESSQTTTSERDEGGSHVTETTKETYDKDLNTKSTETTVVVTNDAGVTTTVTKETEYQRDENGEVTGTTETTNVKVTDGDGKTVAEGSQTRQCDANGETCSSPYVNPDADDTTIVTAEMVKYTLRELGSSITTLPGWTAPGDATPEDPNDVSTVILVDPDLQDMAILADVPRLSGAQPEIRSDLPSPQDAADPNNPDWPR